jgi:two-component sensor histidine kinase
MKHRQENPGALFPGLLLLLDLGISTQTYGQDTGEEWLKALRQAIGQTEKYDHEKLNRIDRLQGQLVGSMEGKQYDLYLAIYEEYASFKCDSAYAYAKKLEDLALQSNDAARTAYARVKISFVLLSSGMFKEAFDFLSKIDFGQLEGRQKAEYYTLMARCYYDLADYNRDVYYSPQYYAPQYNAQAKSYLDSALALFPAGSFQFRYYSGLQHLRAPNLDKAAGNLKSLLNDPHLTPHQTAVTASTLSDIYIRRAQPHTAIALLAQATIADIQSATKETSAVFYLATLLFNPGNMEKASAFIYKAASDAHFYGSRQRKVQLSAILPLIEGQRSKQMQNEKDKLFTYAIGITVSCLLLMALIAIIIKQFRTSKKQQDIIHKKNLSLQSLLGEKNALVHQKDRLLAEKERLLREIHHRVKNNLHVVMSLLNSQAALLKDQAALSAIQESQRRVQAMALIHQKLYQAQGVARIPMLAYIEEVVAYLHECYSLYGEVRFYTEADEIELDVTQAVPLGLIINEAVTNALKYAFPGESPGQVMVALQRLEEGNCRLVVADDGVGLPAGYDPCQSRSLGMTLLHGFSAQLGGDLTITSSRGLTITLVFQEEQLSPTYSRTSYVY